MFGLCTVLAVTIARAQRATQDTGAIGAGDRRGRGGGAVCAWGAAAYWQLVKVVLTYTAARSSEETLYSTHLVTLVTG